MQGPTVVDLSLTSLDLLSTLCLRNLRTSKALIFGNMLRTLLVPYLLITVSLPLFVLFFLFFFAEELFFQLAKDYSVEEEPCGAGKC